MSPCWVTLVREFWGLKSYISIGTSVKNSCVGTLVVYMEGTLPSVKFILQYRQGAPSFL
jgi:hypothetical protein